MKLTGRNWSPADRGGLCQLVEEFPSRASRAGKLPGWQTSHTPKRLQNSVFEEHSAVASAVELLARFKRKELCRISGGGCPYAAWKQAASRTASTRVSCMATMLAVAVSFSNTGCNGWSGRGLTLA